MKKFVKPADGRSVVFRNGRVLASAGEDVEFTPEVAGRVVEGDALIVEPQAKPEPEAKKVTKGIDQ